MKRTFIPVTYDCNNRCISCPVPRRGNRENPSLKSIKEEIDKILEYSNHIELNGGEPTMLGKKLIEILRYIDRKKPDEIGLLTNCELFYYEKYVKEITKIKNLKIITTIYGHNSKIHDAITRTPGSFKYKVKALKNLTKNKLPIELRILLHKMNYKYFGEIANFLINNFNKEDFLRVVIFNPKLTAEAKKNEQTVAIRLTELSKVLEEPIKKLVDKGYKIEIYHFPHCILPKNLWKYSSGDTGIEGEVVFTKKCDKCLKRRKCSKIWSSYLQIFGEEEFKPIERLEEKE